MNKLLFMVWAVASALFVSCSEDEMQNELQHENKGPYTVTFNLSIESGDGLSVSTRSGEGDSVRIDLTKYLVYVYWFHETTGSDLGSMALMDENQPELIDETKYFYTKTFEGDEAEKRHAYLFLAVPKDKGLDEVITKANIKDFGVAETDGYTFSASSQPMTTSSLLKNCYIPFFTDDISEERNNSNTKFSANRKLEIFGEGSVLLPNTNLTEKVVLKRQFGIVRIKANGQDYKGKSVTCEINSDYYRLYLTQMIKEPNASSTDTPTYAKEYVSTNEAESKNGTITGGDYFSTTYQANPSVATFVWKNESITASDLDEEGNINIYLPYTTAKAVGENNIPSEEQTNYSYYSNSASSTSSIKFKIDEKEYEYTVNSTYPQFPIYRNGIIAFYLNGTQMDIEWKDGIDLDNDDWDGIAPNEKNE